MRIFLGAALAASLLPLPSFATNPAAMREVAAIAAEVCGEYKRSGGGTEFELSGGAEAKISGLFKKFVDVGVEGSGSVKKDSYDGVDRNELANELKSTRDCRSDMTKYLLDKLEVSTGPGGGGQQVIARAPDLSGLWSYTGTCPYGVSTVEVQGQFRMARISDTQYSGEAVSSLGLTGRFTSVVAGGNVRSDIQWSDFSYETANGTLSQDGRTMDITDTAGCRTRAFLTN